VGQEAVGDVAVREDRRRDEGRVLDLHLVVDLVLVLQAAEDRDRVLDRGLADHDRLKAPLEGRVLFDVLAVLVKRGRAHTAQLPARQGRLEHVGRLPPAPRRAPRGPPAARGRPRWWRSWMKHMSCPADSVISFRTAFRRSSNSPRYFEPATSAPMSSATSCLPLSPSGTSPATIRCASPSTIAVLPTPGSPMRTGVFLVRRESTWMTRRISSSRPMTGSSLPRRARSVRSREYRWSAWYFSSGFGSVTRWLPRI